MRFEPMPVNPEVIRWARAHAGFSLDDVRDTFKKIEVWEAGEASPTYPQIERLADKFRIPVAVFFFPEPPDVPPITESFRTLPEHELELMPPRMRLLLRKAKAYQLNLFDLTGGTNPSAKSITRDLSFNTNVSITTMVRRVRQYLDVSIEEQSSWSNAAIASENWRNILANVGVSVFKDAFRIPNYWGFCLYDSEFPIIYVNNSSSKTRQIFTLFHELAHLIFHTSGIDTLNDDFIAHLPEDEKKIEIICNRFAAEFLLPEDVFDEAFAGKSADENTAEELASQFHVSREVIYRKFLDRNLIDETTYRRAASRWASQRSQGGSGGDFYNTKMSYLGTDYINLAFSQYYQNRIDDSQLAEYLNVKPLHLGTLEDYVLKGRA